jgi:hypothetical protein
MSQITIQQYPGQLNLANSDMLWEVTSAQSGSPQFQYTCVVRDGCNNTLTTVKQQPNPSGKGVFNLGRIIKQYVESDLYALNITGTGSIFHKNTNTAEFFKVAFGEEFSTSTTGSVTSYTGIGTATGSAAYTGSIPYYYLLNGTLDPNYGRFNWNTSSYFKMEPTPNTGSFSYNVALTDAPRTQYVQLTDYATISLLNGNLNQSTTLAQDVAYVEYTLYSGASIVQQSTLDNIDNTNNFLSGGPRTGSISNPFPGTINTCTTSSGTQTSGSLLLYVGAGPQNLTEFNYLTLTGSWDYYTVKFYPRGTSGPNVSASWDTFTYYKQDPTCGYDGVRFAWLNNYGVWDYFNFTLQEDKTTALDRGLYKQTFVPYNTSTNSVPYNIKRRGTTSYFVNISENFRVYSDWLTQEQADWLGGLFYSPSVYVQIGLEYVPVIINETEFASKTNPRTQKNFQYAVNYTLANNKRSR